MIRSTEIPSKPCAWARWLLRSGPFVVWDTETTGLHDFAKIVSIGIINQDSETLVAWLINPGVPIPSDATAIHGVTDEMVADAPTFAEVYPQIRKALIGQRWVIYNKDYDIPRLRYECKRYGLLYPQPAQMFQSWSSGIDEVDQTHCAMERYAVHWGDFSEYHGNYKWQSLSNAARQQHIRIKNAHNALADAQMTLALIKAMALQEDRSG